MTQALKTSPLSAPQWQLVEQLLRDSDSHQIAWLSGYLAALGMPAKDAAAVAAPASSVLVAHGGETGNCRSVALALAEKARAEGVAVEVADLAQMKVRQLKKCERLILVCSTHGDGDPPEPMEPFYDALMADSAPALDKLQFAVLALGDSSYEHFCVTGRQIDERLEALGATRLHPRQDCDVDYAGPVAEWQGRVLATLPKATQPVVETRPVAAETALVYDKQHPLTVEVLENICLSEASREAALFHLELEMPAGELALAPGDAVGILVDNPPDLVAAVLTAIQLSGEACVSVADQPMTLVEALRQHVDLTIPGARFLTYWAACSDAEELNTLADAATKEQRQFLKQVQVRDLITRHPAVPAPQDFVDALRPLQPRLYDVANLVDDQTDELHLTVKHYRYAFADRIESGIASRFLRTLEPGDQTRLYAHRNTRFHLPEAADVPVILIGEGTGIAPYRAFLQANARQPEPRQSWLVFAENTFEQDFLYQQELQQAHADGALTRVDTVFYDDEPGITLQDRLGEQVEALVEWIEKGAHLYFCGDKGRLADCESSLGKRVDQICGEGRWKALNKQKRLHRNLY
ncbi:diflavin oxidoreductase [Marinobacter sp. 1Y8]